MSPLERRSVIGLTYSFCRKVLGSCTTKSMSNLLTNQILQKYINRVDASSGLFDPFTETFVFSFRGADSPKDETTSLHSTPFRYNRSEPSNNLHVLKSGWDPDDLVRHVKLF